MLLVSAMHNVLTSSARFLVYTTFLPSGAFMYFIITVAKDAVERFANFWHGAIPKT